MTGYHKAAVRPAEQCFYEELAPGLDLPAPRLLASDADGLRLERLQAPAGADAVAGTAAALARLHACCWDQPDGLPAWLRRYRREDFAHCLAELVTAGLPLALSDALAGAAEDLLAGPHALIHGRATPEHCLWRGTEPLLVGWAQVAWTSPFADLGRLAEAAGSTAWLAGYQEALAVRGRPVEPATLLRGAHHGRLWELAVAAWLAWRAGDHLGWSRGVAALHATM